MATRSPRLGRRSPIDAYEHHGFIIQSETETEWVGYCPLSERDGKLYINKTTHLWHSKTANKGGGLHQFLEYRATAYWRAITREQLTTLSKNRGLPVEAFESWQIGFYNGHYSIPVRDLEGQVVDIRRWKPGTRVMSTPACHVGLLGMQQLREESPTVVYVCEGEWDAIALHWLLGKTENPGTVVGVPGAGTFKPAWTHAFEGRTVWLAYDADEAGDSGQDKAADLLGGRARQLAYLHWPASTASGYDVRDFIVEHAIRDRKPKAAWRALKRLFKRVPRHAEPPEGAEGELPEASDDTFQSVYDPDQPPDLKEVQRVFRKWLTLRDTDVIEMTLAIVLAQQFEGDAVWMFLVGPPGGAKTETLISLDRYALTHVTSTLTPAALVSGFTSRRDPSLIPMLDGKTLVIKDFTAILALPEHELTELFGILRDAYDGSLVKRFGNGIVREYKSKFAVLAGVTPQIHEQAVRRAALGERFLIFATDGNLEHFEEDAMIAHALNNVTHETTMRAEMRDVVQSFLAGKKKWIEENGNPVVPDLIKKRIISLSKLVARLRGTVNRDNYRHDVVTGRPGAEVGTRVGKQLMKLCMSLMVVHGGATDRTYNFLVKTAIDTIPQQREDVLRALWELTGEGMAVSTSQLVHHTRYPQATVRRLLDDFAALKICDRINASNRFDWCISDYIKDLCEQSGVYTRTETEVPTVVRVPRLRRKGR